MKNITISLPVQPKYKREASKLIKGDRNVACWYEDAVMSVANTAKELNEKEKKKKLTAEESGLRERMKQILPLLFQLDNDCIDWHERHFYTTEVRKCILVEQKKAARGNKEAVKEFNRLVKMWGKHEPGRFSLIKTGKK